MCVGGGGGIGFILCSFTFYVPHLSHLKSPLCVLPYCRYPIPYPKILQQSLIPAPPSLLLQQPFMQKCPLWPWNASAQELTTAPGSYHMKLKLLALASWALIIQALPACPTVTDSSGQYGQPALPCASLVPSAQPLLSEPHRERSSRSLARPHSLSRLLLLPSALPGPCCASSQS